MSGDADDVDPEAVLERRERRVSKQGHAAVAGALTTAATATATMVLLLAVDAVDVGGFLPVFSVSGLGALAGAWLNGALIERVDDPTRWFRRATGAVLVLAAALLGVAYALDTSPSEAVEVLFGVFAVAWLGAVAATWRFR